jgi:channel protein (hemolysin III family)
VLKAFYKTAHPIVSTCLYLLMGWLIVVAVAPLFARMSTAGLFWLIAGGLSCTAGVAFFATDSRLKYGHLIWHLFVIAGTTYQLIIIACLFPPSCRGALSKFINLNVIDEDLDTQASNLMRIFDGVF